MMTINRLINLLTDTLVFKDLQVVGCGLLNEETTVNYELLFNHTSTTHLILHSNL